MTSVTPLLFGLPERRLFGTFHPAQVGANRQAPVLLADPFGHEAIRTHRFYRVLADRLSRLGHDVLRFNYFGTGESAGDDSDVSLSGWSQDLTTASAELARCAGRPTGTWMAARLGATAALALLGQDGGVRPHHLALWDPVLDGAHYLESLRTKHVEALEASFSVKQAAWRQALADPQAFTDEAVGFAVPDTLRRETLAATPDLLRPPQGLRVSLVLSQDNAGMRAWLAEAVPAATLGLLDKPFDWTSDDSLNTALVPNDALGLLIRHIHGH